MNLKEYKGCFLSILYILLMYFFVIVFGLVMSHYFKKDYDFKYIDEFDESINSSEETAAEEYEEEYDPSYYAIRDY